VLRSDNSLLSGEADPWSFYFRGLLLTINKAKLGFEIFNLSFLNNLLIVNILVKNYLDVV